MSLIGESLSLILPRRGIETKASAAGASIPTWQNGLVQFPNASYERFAREGYSKNEIVYACVEELCSSASEPRLAAWREGDTEPERLPRSPVADLLNRPNPWLSRYAFMSAVIMFRYIAGNVYIEKVRSGSGQVVQLWILRPDRMKIIPDRTNYIGAYEYRIGPETFRLPPRDIIHIKTNSPLNDFYGMAPLAAAMARVDTDNWMRQFIASFFTNAGVPAGILNIKQQLDTDEKEMLNQSYRASFGGGGGWHSLMVLDNVEATYQPLGQSTGARGLGAPDLDEISESRIAGVFGVPLELIGARLGMIHGNRSTTKEARAGFWDETLVPLYREIGEALTLGFEGEFSDNELGDYLAFDLSQVKALQEDEDAKHKRFREDMLAGGISREEFREATGRDPEIPEDHTLMLSSGITPWPMDPAEHMPVDQNAPPMNEDDDDEGDSPDFPELTGAGRQNGNAS